MPSMVPSIIPAIQRPRNSLSQPLPFTVPCPLSVSDMHSFCLCPPHSSVVSQTAASRCIAVWAPVPQADPPSALPGIKTVVTTRRASGERSTGGAGGGGGGQQLWTWKNNSCDSHIVIPTFGSCRVQQRVSSRDVRHGTKDVFHHLAYSIQRSG